jgi:hypothetical protein
MKKKEEAKELCLALVHILSGAQNLSGGFMQPTKPGQKKLWDHSISIHIICP